MFVCLFVVVKKLQLLTQQNHLVFRINPPTKLDLRIIKTIQIHNARSKF